MMNKPEKYIKLKYTPYGYEIFIITENKTTKLSDKSAEIMRKILNKFKYEQIDEDTYIYTNILLIMLEFNKEQNKLTKKQVNRKKSKLIPICIILTASLTAGGLFLKSSQIKKTKLREGTEKK